ncbi:MAG: AMP-binding protein [Xanthobacteraceae bacterium]|nr:AMP-binding protein [Xanthobacteraceae bacterium]
MTPKPASATSATPSLDQVQTLPALLRWRVAQTPDLEAYRQFDDTGKRWVGHSWRDIDRLVEARRRALAGERLDPGGRVAILMPSGIDHVLLDQAVLSLGLVPVPLHALDNPESIAYILQDCGCSLLFIETMAHWDALTAVAGSRLDGLKRVVCGNGVATSGGGDPRLAMLEDWVSAASSRTVAAADVAVSPGDLAAIVYTSGTTGRPKGVMLSHRNILANVKAIQQCLTIGGDDVFLSFLPLSHTLERTAGYYSAIAAGACVAYARSTSLLPDDLKTVRPTVLVSVPRIYERFHAVIGERMAARPWLERKLLDLTVAVGGRRWDARQAHAPSVSLFDRLAWPVLKRLAAAPVLGAFGGRLRAAVSGGAPIGLPIARFFLSLGLDVLQGYGMTETSPVVSTNTPDDNDPLSVGRPLPGVDVKIGDNRELLVRGPSVMVGYWNKPEETRRIIEPDGWLHTGDQAVIRDGRIAIVGRIKDIIVTSTGEKIGPADLELAIQADPLFEQAMVIGEQRPYLAALVVLNAGEWQREKAGLASGADATGSSPEQRETEFLLRRIASAVSGFPAYATPRAVWWTTDQWTLQNGLLTPTLKLKRRALEERFAPQIAKLYPARRPSEATRSVAG